MHQGQAELEGGAQDEAMRCGHSRWLSAGLQPLCSNSLKMTVLVRSVISRAVRLCPWKVAGIKAPGLLLRAPPSSLRSTVTE